MNRILSAVLLVSALCACGEVKEEVWVDASNRIRAEVTWDMTKEPASGGLSLSSLLSKLGSYMPSSVNASLMKTAFEQMGVPYNGQTEIDSTVYFEKLPSLQYKNLLNEIKQKDSRQVLSAKEQKSLAEAVGRAVKGAYATCNINSSRNKYIFKVHTGWISEDDFNTISSGLYKLDDAYGLDLHNVFDGCNRSLLFYVSGKGLKRGTCDYAHLVDVNGNGPFASDSKVKYVFGDGKSYDMVSVFHLPKPVASMSNAKATLSDASRTVTLKLSASDMAAGKTPANDIRY